MQSILDDGRIFETLAFETILFGLDDPVYKIKMITKDREILSSERHKWGVWNKKNKVFEFLEAKQLNKDCHELLIQRWSDEKNSQV